MDNKFECIWGQEYMGGKKKLNQTMSFIFSLFFSSIKVYLLNWTCFVNMSSQNTCMDLLECFFVFFLLFKGPVPVHGLLSDAAPFPTPGAQPAAPTVPNLFLNNTLAPEVCKKEPI